MTDTELKNLKDNLWHSADILRARAHLAANKYGQPILGLIFLRYANVFFKQHKAEIDEEYNRTPASVVQYMVEVLRPVTGDKKFLDPACGSGGMFVQAARYMHRHNATNQDMMSFRCYGVEKEPDTVKLAKMPGSIHTAFLATRRNQRKR